MKKLLKILMLEDNITDAEIIQRVIMKDKPHCKFKLVMNKADFIEALEKFAPDLILSDNTLPQFNATEALKIFHERLLHIPFILVTGTVSEEFAAGIINLGADDYILKDRLKRLPAAIDATLRKKKAEATIKQSEEIRRLVMNAALDAIICIDIKGLVTVWNPQAQKMFGRSEAEMIGKNLTGYIIPHRYRLAFSQSFKHYLTTGHGLILNKAFELVALHRNGTEFPVELAIAHIKNNVPDFFCAFIRDISERKKIDAALKAMERKILDQKVQEQKKISRAIIKAQEQEKNHIGKELHDNISQLLASTKMLLGSAAKKHDAVKELIKYPMELIDNSIQEIRALSHQQVTPLRNINLKNLIVKLLHTYNQSTMPNVVLKYSIANVTLSDGLKLNIYRIIQEQMNNIVKHAAAKNVLISVTTAHDLITVIIKDDGIGFKTTEKRKGIGISNMMNRVESYNGKLKIKSSPGKGCEVHVLVPV